MNAPARQSGAALVAAVFLVVVLALLGAYMVSLSTVQESATTKALQAARVYYAARAGMEWAIHRTLATPPSMCGLGTAVQRSFTLDGPGLSGISVATTCSYQNVTDGGNVRIFYITSTAAYGSAGSVDYAERRLDAITSDNF